MKIYPMILIRDSPDAFMSKEESDFAHVCCFILPQYKGYFSFDAPQDFHSEVYIAILRAG